MPETTLIAGTDTSGKLTRADLALVPTPYSTSTHQVIPHIDIVQALEEQLGFRHIAIASEEYAVTKDGKNFFGVMTLDQGMDGASFALGVRNSHSKQFRLSIVVGLRIFVCSKGEGDEAENFHLASTLSQDSFPTKEFDFMLSNPPYGKSWKTDLDRMGGKGDVRDPRFVIEHAGDAEYSLITRSSDGQLMFLANKLSKMKRKTAGGSRIAEVHNGSSLFTGDAGQGESNIRRWILENDWLEAIIALPLNTFYNTGIATFIWVLSNRKAEHRRGKVQLIDASAWFRPLRKNLGKKNCELSEEDILRVTDTFLAFKENDKSQIFPNEAFGNVIWLCLRH